MNYFQKKQLKSTQRSEDQQLISKNAVMIDVLISLTSNATCKEELKKLQEKLQYLTASDLSKVYDGDKKIANAIDDFKQWLYKEKDDAEKTAKMIKELYVLIAERNSKL